jgi:hypothetical protein
MLPLSSPYVRTAKPDTGIKNISTVNTSVLITVVWFLVSVISVVLGFWHCRANAYNYAFICDNTRCVLEYPVGGKLPDYNGQLLVDEFNKLAIQKDDIVISKSVSLDENNLIVDTTEMTTRAIAKLGLTTQITYKYYNNAAKPTEFVNHSILFPPIDQGRRKARGALRKLQDYTSGRITVLNQQHGRMVTAPGILGVIFGIVSIILSLVLGTWADDKTRRPWARGRKRAD